MATAHPEPEVRSITLAPRLAEVSRGRALLTEIASQAGFSAERVFDITVACSEAMANAIEHSPVKGEVLVRTILRWDRLEVEVQGPGEFQTPDRLSKRETRGLGLPLMAKLSDHLALFSGPKGETFVSLTFYRPGVEIGNEGAVPPTFANLAEENRLLDDILKSLPDAFFVLDHEGRFVYLNPEALDRVDMSLDDLIGRDVWEVFPDFAPILRHAFEEAEAERSGRQVTAATPDNHWREWTAFPVEDGLAIWARDVTDRKRAEQEQERLLADEQVLNEELAATNEELAATTEEIVAQTQELIERETALRESEERFRSVLDNSLDGLYRVNLQTGHYEYMSPAFGATIGHSNEEFTRLSPETAIGLVHPDDLPHVLVALGGEHATAAGEVEYRILGSDGEYRWVSNHFSQTTDIEGRPLYRDGIVRNISERKRAEEAIAAVNEQLTQTLENVQELSYSLDHQWKFLWISDTAAARYGKKREEMIGRDIWEMFPALIGTTFEENYRAAMEQREIRRFEAPGTITGVWYHVSVFPSPPGITVFGMDITDQKRTENELRETAHELRRQKELLERLFNTSRAGIGVVEGPELRYVLANEITRAQAEGKDIVGRRYEEVFPQAKEAAKRLRDVLETGEPWVLSRFHAPIPGKPNAVWEGEVVRLEGEDGDLDTALAISWDVTERAQAEQTLRESEERFRMALANAPVSLAAQDRDLRYVWAYNQVSARPEEVIGRTDSELFPDQADYLTAIKRDMLETGEPKREKLWVTRPGRRFFLDVQFTPLRGASGEVTGIWITSVDLTEQQLAAEALRKSESRFRALFETNPDAAFLTIPDGTIIATNPAAVEMLGWSEDELLKLRREAILDTSDPRVAAGLREREEKGVVHAAEATAIRKSGERFPVEIDSVILRDDANESYVVMRDISDRKQTEERLRRSEERGAFLLELSDSVRPLADPIAVQETASRLLGEHLHADRVTYFEVRGDDYIVERDYAPAVPHLSGRYPIAAFRERLLATYRAGRMVVSNDIAEDPIPPAERDSFFSIQVHAQISVPLVKNGEFVGGLAVHSATPRTWTPHEMRLTEDTAERTWAAVELARAEDSLRESEERHRALAAENERLYRQQLDIAEKLQSGLLNIPSEIGPLRVGHLYRSATEAAKVGGDFYDVFELKDGKFALLVGDVSGHGIQAARTATLVKDVVHGFAHQSTRPHEVVKRTNELLVEKNLPGFVTLLLGIVDTETGTLRYVSAGHPEALLRRASGQVELLGSGSSPLGVFPDAVWKQGIVELEPEDLLVLYTDGVLEARRNGEFFGLERLEAVVKRKRLSVERLPQAVIERVLAFSGGRLNDDVAVLAVLFGGKTLG